MRTDLHIHTTASDGCWDPERLLLELKKKGLQVFSVTDHDSVANVSVMRKLAEEAALTFIPGVEISTTVKGHMFHVLAYGIDPENGSLLQLLSDNTRLMQKKDDDSIKKLIDSGLEIDFDQYLAYENDPSRGGWKALNFLIDAGLCRDAGDFFRRLFRGDLKVPFPVFPSPRRVLEVVDQAGGTPVLAHPGSPFNKKFRLEDILEEFLAMGIKGVECFHPEHELEKTRFCHEWTAARGLIVTGGSDCHGEFIGSRRLGEPSLLLQDLNLGNLLAK